jgi:hypothetical protein
MLSMTRKLTDHKLYRRNRLGGAKRHGICGMIYIIYYKDGDAGQIYDALGQT